MKKMSHVIERKDFIQNMELKKKYEEQSIDESNCQLHNILTREEFVNDEDLRNRYRSTGTNLPLLESIQDVKLLGKEERVLGFEDYTNRKDKEAV